MVKNITPRDTLTFPTLKLPRRFWPRCRGHHASFSYHNHGLTAVPNDLIFGMYIYVRSRIILGYIILTFQVNKDHLRSKMLHLETTSNFQP